MIAWLQGWFRREWLALAALVVLAGANGPATVRIALREQPNTLNPLVSTQYDENYLTEAIFSGLTKLDDRGHAQPDLAQAVPTVGNGGISRDGKTLVYRLRRNARWQDGVPVTADDVVFTFAKIRDTSVPYVSRTLYDAVERVEARDAHTVVIHLAHPQPDAPYELFVAGQNGEIVPRHLLAGTTDMLHAPFNAAPIGSGAYRVERWDRGSSLTLLANHDYFGGAPAVEKIVVSFVPDSNTRALGVLSHDFDLAPIEPINAAAAAATPDVRVVSIVQPYLIYLHLRVDAPPFDDVNVRRGLTAVIDRADLTRKAYLGQALPADEIVPPESPFHVAGGVRPPDAAAARRALDAAGWRVGSDGMRQRNGERLSIVITCIAGNAPMLRTAVVLQSNWKDLGVDSTVRPLPSNLLFGPDGILARGNFTVALVNYGFPLTPDRSAFLSSGAIPPNGYNYGHLRDPVLDRLISDAHYSLDTARRKRLYAQIAARVAAEIPVFPLVWQKAVFAISTHVDGIRPEPVNSDLWNANTWRVR